MATEKGIVISKFCRGLSSIVLVKADRSSACKSCTSRSSCGKNGNSQEIEIEIEISNTANIHVGDVVLLGIKSAPLLKATFLIYIFPILFMLFGVLLGNVFALLFNPIDNSKISIVCAFLFLIFSFFIVSKVGVKLSSKNEYKPKIIKIINHSSYII